MLLSRLRGLPQLIIEEQNLMPIPIDSDILDLPIIRDFVLARERRVEARGEAKGEATLLRHQLERRFGALPDEVLSRLASADTTALEAWGLRLLDAAALEDVFQP